MEARAAQYVNIFSNWFNSIFSPKSRGEEVRANMQLKNNENDNNKWFFYGIKNDDDDDDDDDANE